MPVCEVCHKGSLAIFGKWFLLEDGSGDAFICDECAEMYDVTSLYFDTYDFYVHPAPLRLQ